MTTSNSNNSGNNFDEILDRCLRAVESGQMTVEQCAARYPNYPELASLLGMAVSLYGLPHPQMPAAVTNQMQRRLQTQFRERMRQSVPSSTPSLVLRRVLLTFAVLLIIIVGGGAGLVYASSSALPGDTLYGVKRNVEDMRLNIASGDRSQVLYDLAETRLNEIHGLAARGRTVQEAYVNDMYNSVDQAIGLQSDNAKRTQLTSDAENALQDALNKRMISPALAGFTTQKLEILMSLYVPPTPTQTPTPAVAVNSTTPAPSATNTPQRTASITLTPSFTASSTETAAPPSATLTPTNTPLPSLTPSRTIPAPVLGPSNTATLGRGPAVTIAGLATRTPTATSTMTATGSTTTAAPTTAAATTEAATQPATEPASATATATDTLTATATATLTFTPTFTATLTPTATPTSSDTATSVPTPNGLPSADLKQAPQEITFHDCKPEGTGGDPVLNQNRNRVDEARQYPPTGFDNIAGFPWPKDAEGKPHDQWSQQTKDAIAQAEGLPVNVEVNLIKVQEDGPEAQNCNSSFHTWRLWLLPAAGNDLSKALVAAISPRVAANHAGWTLDKLNALAASGARVRISGWLLFNEEQAGEVGKSRVSLWEIHPVMQIAVSKNNQWVNLDDYQS